ncbi:MAG: VCBS repeat-containing protein [Cyanobacteria bacterium P01_F01_bin.4]
MATTVLYDPITNPDPTALGYLTYGQLPLSPLFIAEFPPADVTDVTDVFEVLSLFDPANDISSDGINLDTNGLVFNNLPGYVASIYYLSEGDIKVPTGNTFSANARTGYAGFANHSIDVDLANIDLQNLDIEAFLNDVKLTPVNGQFPTLDAEQGFTLTFDLQINEEDSDPNRAGFSLIVISDDRTKGIEIGFKEEGTNSDRVFAQNANLNGANTAGEDSSASLEIKNDNQYSLTFSDNGYQLKANNTLLLQGELRDYSFDPTNSEPPFPSNVNPYETPNFVFFGDDTDQGYADFTLGKISIEIEDGVSPNVPAQPDFNNDQKADLVWHNAKTGQNTLWLMDGATVLNTADIDTVSNLNWQLEGTGDIDQNGTADLVWRNHKNGNNSIWFMDGATVDSTAFIDSVTNLNWHIEGAGDFDGNGNLELVWRNQANGKNAFWEMDGATVVKTDFIDAVENLNWHIQGVGDYNNNGRADLVWRNQANGNNALWYMNGTSLDESVFTDAFADLDWQIAVA